MIDGRGIKALFVGLGSWSRSTESNPRSVLSGERPGGG